MYIRTIFHPNRRTHPNCIHTLYYRTFLHENWKFCAIRVLIISALQIVHSFKQLLTEAYIWGSWMNAYLQKVANGCYVFESNGFKPDMMWTVSVVVTLVFRPMRMPKIQIMCLFILYKPQTVLSILAFIWNRALTLYEIVLCPCSKN